MTHRPCGACRSLVPAETGCKHWKPRRPVTQKMARKIDMSPKAVTARELRRREREDARARVAAFSAMMGRTYR